MLRTDSLSYTYPGQQAIQFPDLTASPGSPLLVLGESGSGKTTLLHLLGGLLQIQSGSIEVAGQNLANLSGRELDRFRGKNIGIVLQQPHFLEALSVGENLQLASYLPGVSVPADRKAMLLDDLGIRNKVNKSPRNLSVGEQQRVAIARALMNQPDVLLADEPTSALDDKNCEAVLKLLRHASAEVGATLVIVTHDNRLKDQFDHQLILA